MLVKILKPVVYEPRAGEPRRTFGQLRSRPARRQVEIEGKDGTTITTTVRNGPMEHYFPIGRTPDVPDAVALAWIAQEIAEPYTLDAAERSAPDIIAEMRA